MEVALAVPEFFLLGPTAHRPPGDLWPEWGLKWSGKWEVGKSPEHERVVLVVLVLVGKSNAVGGDSFLLPGAKWVKVICLAVYLAFWLSIYRWGSLPLGAAAGQFSVFGPHATFKVKSSLVWSTGSSDNQAPGERPNFLSISKRNSVVSVLMGAMARSMAKGWGWAGLDPGVLTRT
ncbi:uncharacterized protein An02g11350 [Aspergillus niger]|uniref:Contig An02c0330, genomic contig n=2 Tax=Aspergillus niger TaxID=5061 RepID=A2QEK1_ASPNC|nr:uncharacterized protein An02g11350 [Aspergillus niger]CAK44465.1 unnamed protein product [Aspergillus niger]